MKTGGNTPFIHSHPPDISEGSEYIESMNPIALMTPEAQESSILDAKPPTFITGATKAARTAFVDTYRDLVDTLNAKIILDKTQAYETIARHLGELIDIFSKTCWVIDRAKLEYVKTKSILRILSLTLAKDEVLK